MIGWKGPSRSRRLIELDVLRCLAILLVLLAHLTFLELTKAQTEELAFVWPASNVGWIGVPIFFVLSGFLIGNLLIREYVGRGTIRVGRFFVRRGFKIYPLFYLCIFLYAGYLIAAEGTISTERLLREIFFLQNYGKGGLIDVSWSLAVEEHFYLVFPFLCLLLIRWRGPKHAGKAAVFRPLIAVALVLAAVCLVLRIGAVNRWPFDLIRSHYGTHLRIDALFIGAALAYWYNASPDSFHRFFRKIKIPGLLLTAGIFGFAMVQLSDPESAQRKFFFMRTFYITLLSLGSAALIGISLEHSLKPNLFWRSCAYIGSHSYGIYLFHVPFIRVLNNFFLEWFAPYSTWFLAFFTIAGSCAVGALVSKLVEYPMLRVRDRLFPSMVSRYFGRNKTTDGAEPPNPQSREAEPAGEG